MLTQAHVFVKGEVIGVGFRAWTKIQANQLGIKGWVRNNFERPDVFGPYGGVECVLQGKEGDVEMMIKLLKQGSAISRVTGVDVYYQKPKEIFGSFEIKK